MSAAACCIDVNVVMWVAVVGYQGAPAFITCQLDLILVDLVHCHGKRLAIDLDNGLVRVHCGSGYFGVNVRVSGFDVPAGPVELQSVGGLRALLVAEVNVTPKAVMANVFSLRS